MFRKNGSWHWIEVGYVGNVERYISAIIDGLDKPKTELDELQSDIRKAYKNPLRSFFIDNTEFKFTSGEDENN